MVHKTGQPSRSLLEVGVQGPVFRGLHSSGEAVYGNVLLGGGFPLVLSSNIPVPFFVEQLPHSVSLQNGLKPISLVIFYHSHCYIRKNVFFSFFPLPTVKLWVCSSPGSILNKASSCSAIQFEADIGDNLRFLSTRRFFSILLNAAIIRVIFHVAR